MASKRRKGRRKKNTKKRATASTSRTSGTALQQHGNTNAESFDETAVPNLESVAMAIDREMHQLSNSTMAQNPDYRNHKKPPVVTPPGTPISAHEHGSTYANSIDKEMDMKTASIIAAFKGRRNDTPSYMATELSNFLDRKMPPSTSPSDTALSNRHHGNASSAKSSYIATEISNFLFRNMPPSPSPSDTAILNRHPGNASTAKSSYVATEISDFLDRKMPPSTPPSDAAVFNHSHGNTLSAKSSNAPVDSDTRLAAAPIEAQRDQFLKDLMVKMPDFRDEMELSSFTPSDNSILTRYHDSSPSAKKHGDMTSSADTLSAAKSIKNKRNKLLISILANIPKHHRTRFITICHNSIPQKVFFLDGAYVIYILSRTGHVDLDDKSKDRFFFNISIGYAYRIRWWCSINDDGRINGLGIIGHTDSPFDVPSSIIHLDELSELTVYHCRSLPEELASLTNLDTLRLYLCPEFLNTVEMELSQLKTLEVYESQLPAPFLQWMTRSLPNLEHLVFDWLEKSETEIVTNVLNTSDVCFRKSLKTLEMEDCNVDDEQFESLLFDTVPVFENMTSLNLCDNKIQSTQDVTTRIENETCVASKSIRRIDLTYNPIMKKFKKDEKEKVALLSLLANFNKLCKLGCGSENYYDSDVEYILQINHAGRILVEGKGILLPLSVWPTIMARASNSPTGMHYLVCNGPALVCRSNLLGSGKGSV